MMRKFRSVYLSIFERYPAFVSLAILTIAAQAGYSMMTVSALPVFLSERFSAGFGFIGLAIAAFTGAEMVCKPFFGHLGDRLGRKQMMLAGVGISAVTPLLMTLMPLPYPIALLRLLDGMGSAALWPAISASAAEAVKPDEKATAMSVFNMAYMIGIGCGPLAGMVLLGSLENMSHIFYIVSAIFALAFIIAMTARWPAPEKAAGEKDGNEAYAGRDDSAGYGRSIFSRDLNGMYLMGALQMMGITALAPILMKYLTDVAGIARNQMPIYFLVPTLGIALFSIPIGRAVDKGGKRTAIIAGAAGAAMAIWLIPSTVIPLMLLPLALMAGLGFVMAVPAWLALITEMAPKGRVGAVLGILGLAQGAGAVLGPVAGGCLKDISGYQWTFYLSATLLTMTMLLAIIFVKTSLPAEEAVLQAEMEGRHR